MAKFSSSKYWAHRGPFPEEPAAVHIAFHLADLANDLTPRQRKAAEIALEVWQRKARMEAAQKLLDVAQMEAVR